VAERARFEAEMESLDLRERFWGGWTRVPARAAAAAVPPATVGFEFDVHYGLIREVVEAAGKTMPASGDRVTVHTGAADGFEVKRDGTRVEFATVPFPLTTAGKTELARTTARMLAFARELQSGCAKAKPKNIAVPGTSGRPSPFLSDKTFVVDLPLVKLPVGGRFQPGNCSVWASPQATVTVPLHRVGDLVEAIRKSEGKGAGVALTGDRRHRMGLQSKAIYDAKAAVLKARADLIRRTPKLRLSDGTEVDATTFTGNLTGFLILLAEYLRTSELAYDFTGARPRDYEMFAKAYLPVNVKTPFPQIHRELLTPAERLLFRELFAAGSARERLFRLARPGATAADGSTKLFPAGRTFNGTAAMIHESQRSVFGSAPTWDDLVAHTLDSTHRGFGDRLLVGFSKKIDVSKTKPRVALELRRIGFAAVFSRQWPALMNQVAGMVERLNR